MNDASIHRKKHKEKLRICILGGASFHIYAWAQGLAKRGNEVYIITDQESDVDYLIDIEALGVRTYKLPFSNRMFFYFNAFPLRNLLRKLKPDVLFSHYLTTYGFLGALSGFRPHISFVWGIETFVRRIFPHRARNLKEKLKATFNYWFSKFALNHIDVIQSPSRLVVELAKRMGAPRVKRCFRGAEKEVFEKVNKEKMEEWRSNLRIPLNAKVVLDPRPGLRGKLCILEALQIIKNNFGYPVIFIILRGVPQGGKERDVDLTPLIYKVKEKKLEEFVRVINCSLPPNEVAALFHISDAFLSLAAQEDLSRMVLEGMLCGCLPILSSNLANREIIEDYGVKAFLVNNIYDPKEIGEAIFRALEIDSCEREKIIKYNKEWVLQNATWEMTIEKTLKLFDECLSRHSP
jgi:glycosyltransferase involved in cell wall biosynthesis